MAKETLLQKALKIKRVNPSPKDTSDELQELSIAWIKNEISIMQFGKVLEKGMGSGLYCDIARSLKALYKKGKLKLK